MALGGTDVTSSETKADQKSSCLNILYINCLIFSRIIKIKN